MESGADRRTGPALSCRPNHWLQLRVVASSAPNRQFPAQAHPPVAGIAAGFHAKEKIEQGSPVPRSNQKASLDHAEWARLQRDEFERAIHDRTPHKMRPAMGLWGRSELKIRSSKCDPARPILRSASPRNAVPREVRPTFPNSKRK